MFFPIDEFNDYEIDSEFMFFSGCNTGKVKTVQNEELLGIMSVLLSGKTSSAILSFWPVLSLSDATKGIVEAFYKNWLQDKMPKTIALQEAMLLYRERANPYEWASYSLFGNCF